MEEGSPTHPSFPGREPTLHTFPSKTLRTVHMRNPVIGSWRNKKLARLEEGPRLARSPFFDGRITLLVWPAFFI